nr:hypothetical protein [uncultured Pseudomonas sp.]
MKPIFAGDKLAHVKAPGFINEEADQSVGFVFGPPDEPRISLTFGRDKMTIVEEVYVEASKGLFRPQPHNDGFYLERVDFGTFTMRVEAAIRLRAMLTDLIDKAESGVLGRPVSEG